MTLLTPQPWRHARFTGKHHRKVVAVFKATTRSDIANQHLSMPQQKLRLANPQLTQIVTDGHPGLLAKALA